jgi:hypothetical protein
VRAYTRFVGAFTYSFVFALAPARNFLVFGAHSPRDFVIASGKRRHFIYACNIFKLEHYRKKMLATPFSSRWYGYVDTL